MDEINEAVKTGLWVGDCFVYTTAANCLSYYVGGDIVALAHLDRPMYILGYVAKENRSVRRRRCVRGARCAVHSALCAVAVTLGAPAGCT